MHLKSLPTPKVYEISSHVNTHSQVCPYLFSEEELVRYDKGIFFGCWP